MQANETEREFSLAGEPVIGSSADLTASNTSHADIGDLGELPRSYDAPVLVAIARDPHTLFVYWNIDWPVVFGDSPPADRAAHLRVRERNGAEQLDVDVEPLAGSCYVTVDRPGAEYTVELGYQTPTGEWKSVATTNRVVTPRDTVAQSAEFQLTTVPLHLTFQRMIEMFRGSRFDAQTLGESLAKLQQRAASTEPDAALPAEHLELIAAITAAASSEHEGVLFETSAEEPSVRARIERILGIAGTTSPGANADAGGSS